MLIASNALKAKIKVSILQLFKETVSKILDTFTINLLKSINSATQNASHVKIIRIRADTVHQHRPSGLLETSVLPNVRTCIRVTSTPLARCTAP